MQEHDGQSRDGAYFQENTELLRLWDSVLPTPDLPISAALGVLHHQHVERKVRKLLHGFQECN